jgi:hypothetical protein
MTWLEVTCMRGGVDLSNKVRPTLRSEIEIGSAYHSHKATSLLLCSVIAQSVTA